MQEAIDAKIRNEKLSFEYSSTLQYLALTIFTAAGCDRSLMNSIPICVPNFDIQACYSKYVTSQANICLKSDKLHSHSSALT